MSVSNIYYIEYDQVILFCFSKICIVKLLKCYRILAVVFYLLAVFAFEVIVVAAK